MSSHVRSLATLVVLALVLVLAAVWGWSAIRQPFPKESSPPPCRDREFAKGDVLKPRDVTVSVWNSGKRVGLAGLTMNLLVEDGFDRGAEGNTPGKRRVERVEIWTDEPQNPAVQLVASHLGKVDIVKRSGRAPGVLVVVGDGFEDLVPGKKSVTVRADATVCGPPRLAS